LGSFLLLICTVATGPGHIPRAGSVPLADGYKP
jgi:hypothetical protein